MPGKSLQKPGVHLKLATQCGRKKANIHFADFQ
jgi:hypothetical protein